MRVIPATPGDLPWLTLRAGVELTPKLLAVKAVDADGNIKGMVGYDGWTPNAACIHVACDSPLALRSLILPGFRIPFLELGKEVLIATVLSTNEKSIGLVKRLGFREVFRGRGWFVKDADLLWFEMRKVDCPWLVVPKGRRAA